MFRSENLKMEKKVEIRKLCFHSSWYSIHTVGADFLWIFSSPLSLFLRKNEVFCVEVETKLLFFLSFLLNRMFKFYWQRHEKTKSLKRPNLLPKKSFDYQFNEFWMLFSIEFKYLFEWITIWYYEFMSSKVKWLLILQKHQRKYFLYF